jgi:hypothetical protein
VAKKDVSLLIRLNKSDMDGMEEAILVLRWVLLSHTADFSTNGLYGKEHRGRGEKCRDDWRFDILSRLFFTCLLKATHEATPRTL